MKIFTAAFYTGMCAAAVGIVLVFQLHTATRYLEAAIGNLPIPILRLWQRQNGFNRYLQYGSRGADVLLLQQSLATDPTITANINPNRYFGVSTRLALMQFQAEYQLSTTGIFDLTTRSILNQILLLQLCPKPAASEPDLSLAHITRNNGLPQDYVPSGLVEIQPPTRTLGIICVTPPTAAALSALFLAAQQDGVDLSVCSGYRGSGVQTYLFQQYPKTLGGLALREIAPPYHSEHQLGTVIDFAAATEGYLCAPGNFGITPEGTWLIHNAWRYGFSLSYPASLKSGGTLEYIYEPWHWRYLGAPLAAQLHQLGISYNELPATGSTTIQLTINTSGTI